MQLKYSGESALNYLSPSWTLVKVTDFFLCITLSQDSIKKIGNLPSDISVFLKRKYEHLVSGSASFLIMVKVIVTYSV